MDYCEWKNGYRGEAMVSTARELAGKISGKISSYFSSKVKGWVGYNTGSYGQGIEQTDSVKFMLFAMWTIIPSVTAIAGVIPMLFYKLSGAEKERMYADLQARRAALAAEADEM